jgi:molecular chaperone DnaK
VSAKDLGTGKQQQIRIESSSGLSEGDIQRMVKEAESNAAADKEEKERIEIKNQADQAIYQTEKTLSDIGDKIPESDKTAVQKALDDLKEKANGTDYAAMKSSMEALMKASHAMAEAMYKKANPAEASGPQPGPPPPSDPPKQESGGGGDKKGGAVDADFEVVD